MTSPLASFVSVLKECESASGEGSKKAIKESLAKLDATGQELFKLAMDPFVVFGIKKFDRLPQSQYSSTDNTNVQGLLFKVLDQLSSGELTGNAARTAWANTLAEFTWETASYLERVVDKDLRAGFSDETFNKVHKNNPVRIFNVMLADKCETEEDFEAITFPCIADIKYDGERNVAFQLKTGTNFAPEGSSYFSRSGKPAAHMAGLFDEELARIRDYLGYDFVLDGERMASNYIETINAKKSGAEGEAGKKNMRFRAFFIMPLTDWLNQSTRITMAENRHNLQEILSACKCEKIILSDAREVKDYADMMAFLDDVTTPGFDGLEKGQEGLILKRFDATYNWDRTLDWCKVKKFFDADARILNWEFGKKKSKNEHRMGRVNVAGYTEDGTYFECGVGSGWNDAQRDDFVKNFETNWKDRTIVLRYQEISLGKGKTVHSLRFPTFERGSRDDKFIRLPHEA